MTDYIGPQAADDVKYVPLPISDLEQVFSYDEDGNVSTISVVYEQVTYVQTFTYGDDGVASISQWVPQP